MKAFLKSNFGLILFAIILPLIFVVLFESLMHYRFKQEKMGIANLGKDVGKVTQDLILTEINKVSFLNRGIEAFIKTKNGQLLKTDIQLYLQELAKDQPYLKNISISENTIIKYVYPLDPNKDILNKDLKNFSDQWPEVSLAINSKKGILSGPQNLNDKESGLIFRHPIIINNTYWGLISTVIDINKILNSSIYLSSVDEASIAIRNNISTSTIYGDANNFIKNNNNTYVYEFELKNQIWQIAVTPTKINNLIYLLTVVLWVSRFALASGIIILFFAVRFYLQNIKLSSRYRVLTDNISDIIWIYNTALKKYTYFSPSVEKVRGFTVNEALNKVLGDDLLPHSKEYIFKLKEEKISEFLNTNIKEQYRFEMQQYHKNGHVIWLDSVAYFSFNDKNELEIHGISRDITKQKEAKKILEKSKDELRKLDETRNKFFNIIAHDLKSPFNSVISLLDLINTNYSFLSDKEKQSYFKLAHEATQQGSKLVDNLFIWAKSQTGDIPFIQIPLNLLSLSNEAIETVKIAAFNKNITIQNYINEDMSVYIDRNMIDTTLRNLISNAVKFTNKNGTIIIRTNANLSNSNMVQISIQDSGIGMNDKQLKKLFAADQTFSTKGTENESGSGLGLILCKEFIERHDGKIWAESNLGHSSTFHFTLPKA